MRRSSVLVVAASLLAGLAVSMPTQASEMGVTSQVVTPASVADGRCDGASWVWRWFSRKSMPTTWNDNKQINCWLEKDTSRYRIGTVALQRALKNKNGFNRLTIDGYFGQETKDAILRIQEMNDLPYDGVYGPSTRDEMSW